jgi:ketosteroid isomerase-like protein
MISAEEQMRIAVELVTKVAGGGIDPKYYADDLTVWTSGTGIISREEYLPKLAVAKHVWIRPLTMKIDSSTAQPGRVVLQTRSHGLLITEEEYSNEYMFLIEFNTEGKVRHIREYYNAERVRTIYKPAVAKWQALQGAKTA